MNDWINLTALWQIVVVGLIAGAGLPALFASSSAMACTSWSLSWLPSSANSGM